MNGTLIEIFATDQGSVSQCNLKNHFRLDFAGGHSYFKVSDFLHFVQKVNEIDLKEMVNDVSRKHDLCVLMPLYTDRCFVLTLTDIVNLRDILNGAKFTLSLNSLLRECLSCSFEVR